MSDTDTFERAQAQGLAKLVSLGTQEPPVRVADRWTRAGLVVTTELEPVRPAKRARYFRLTSIPWPLLGILAVQALLSLRLVWRNTAFADEALYLWAGHLEWAHWLHGVNISAASFPSYFSGAPVLYPPLGALADSIDGLAGARILSLMFMLGATALLYSTAKRMHGRVAAAAGALLFAVAGPVLHLGAFATYDAMSLLLIALAAWLVAYARRDHDSAGWMALAAMALVAANATAYSSLIMDPIVFGLAVARSSNRRDARIRIGSLSATFSTAVVLLLKAGGHPYEKGLLYTVLNRAPENATPLEVLHTGLQYAWPLLVVAVVGVLVLAIGRQRQPYLVTSIILAAAPLLVIVAQMHDHTVISLDKHVALGLWFAAIPAGQFVGYLTSRPWLSLRIAAAVISTVSAAAAGLVGAQLSVTEATSWSNAALFVTVFRQYTRSHGPLLVEDPSIAEYYESAEVQWQRWSSTWALNTPKGVDVLKTSSASGIGSGVAGVGNSAVYARYIAKGYFQVIALNLLKTPALDHEIVRDLTSSHLYRFAAKISYGSHYYRIWTRT